MNGRCCVFALVVGLLVLPSTRADGIQLGAPLLEDGGSWRLQHSWVGVSGYDFHSFVWDTNYFVHRSGDFFDTPYVTNPGTNTPPFNMAGWSLDSAAGHRMKISGPDVSSLGWRLHFNNDATPGLGKVNFWILSFADGVLEEWADVNLDWDFGVQAGLYTINYRDPGTFDPGTIPEPSSLLLAAMGLIGLGLARRRQR